jgi:glycosyltransferase involved in cell wall biosynthesis
MIPTQPFGLFVLANPVLIGGGEIRFGDRCYTETLNQTSTYVHHSLVVARTRHQAKGAGFYTSLHDAGAELALPLPDYGMGGLRGIFRVLEILSSSKIRSSLLKLIKQAEFIYVEGGTSPVSLLIARLAAKSGRRLILEMRGSTVLNPGYMRRRFGLAGMAYLGLHNLISDYVRRYCVAGLYINKDLMMRFPIAGKLRRAISDVYLPKDFGGLPRFFTDHARSFLYVGHLEAVKRVDLILKALHMATADLPEGWRFDIVGSGPEEGSLRSLTDQLGLKQNVTFHGRVEWGAPLARFYRNADVLLMASTTESGPRSLVEASAFGLPVLITHVGIAPELLDKTVLVPVDDTKTYAKMLAGLVNDTARLTDFSHRNWRLAQNFKQSSLQIQRKEFWEQAIQLSQRGKLKSEMV